MLGLVLAMEFLVMGEGISSRSLSPHTWGRFQPLISCSSVL